MPRRQLAPDDVVLLAPVDRLRIEAVFLRWIRGQEPRAPLVLERPEHAPRMDRRHLLELGRGLRKLSRSERKLSQHLPGERAHVRPRPGRASDLIEGGHQGSQVPLLLLALVEAEEIGDGLRPIDLPQDARLERRRALIERGGRGEQGEKKKAVHAIETAGPSAPFLGSEHAVARRPAVRHPSCGASVRKRPCYQGARASVRTSTLAAPAFRSASAAAAAVAPVVRTSSMMQTLRPLAFSDAVK